MLVRAAAVVVILLIIFAVIDAVRWVRKRRGAAPSEPARSAELPGWASVLIVAGAVAGFVALGVWAASN